MDDAAGVAAKAWGGAAGEGAFKLRWQTRMFSWSVLTRSGCDCSSVTACWSIGRARAYWPRLNSSIARTSRALGAVVGESAKTAAEARRLPARIRRSFAKGFFDCIML